MNGQIVTVDFRNDTIFAVERSDGVYVAVRPIAERLGLAWPRQFQRIKDDPILSEGVTTMVTPSPGGPQEMTCLRLDLVNGWLFKIDSRRVKDDDVRQRVLVYQRECYRVLFEHFHGKPTSARKAFDFDGVEPELSVTERRKLTELMCRFGGPQATTELWLKLGLPPVPALFAEQQQMSFFGYANGHANGHAPTNGGAAP